MGRGRDCSLSGRSAEAGSGETVEVMARGLEGRITEEAE